MTSHILETHTNAVMLHGNHIHKTALFMAMAKCVHFHMIDMLCLTVKVCCGVVLTVKVL